MQKADHHFFEHVPIAARALAYARFAQSNPGVVLVEHGALAEELATQTRFFDSSLEVFVFPDWEILPYDPFSPDSELISERLHTLAALANRRFHLVFAPVSAAMQRLAPPSFLLGQVFMFEKGLRLSVAALKEQLVQAGYTMTREVLKPGEFASRGGLMDVFPMGSATPFRLEFEEDRIASLRTFNPETQRTIEKVDRIRFLPGREFPSDEKRLKAFAKNFAPVSPMAFPRACIKKSATAVFLLASIFIFHYFVSKLPRFSIMLKTLVFLLMVGLKRLYLPF